MIRIAWLPGLFLGLAILVQHGLLLLEGLIFVSLIVFRRKAWALGSLMNLTAFAVTLPLGLYSFLHNVPLAHTHFGGFQPLVLAEATLFYTALWLFTFPPQTFPRGLRPWIVGSVTMVTLVAGGFLLRETLTGASYLIRTWSGWQTHIGESQSFLDLPLGEAVSQLSMQMSWIVLLLPLAVWIALRRWRHHSPLLRFLIVAAIAFTGLGALQMRYLPYLALVLGLMVGPGGRVLHGCLAASRDGQCRCPGHGGELLPVYSGDRSERHNL